MAIQSINPATEEVLASFDEFTSTQIDEALDEVAAAFKQWRAASFAERAEPMRRAARYLRANKQHFAGLITAEMGKPIAEAEAEIEKCAWNCDFYAEHAASFLADEPVATNARESFVAFEPLGPVLAIMPWNFPFWQVFRFAAPALMAGDTAVLKHASNVPQCALAIAEAFRESGFPRGAFRTLLIPSSAVDALIDDDRIAAVTLTGSDVVGRHVAAAAGRALKRHVMELGGSDPFIVLEDADLNGAADFATRSRFQNTGQSCIAAKRFIVVEQAADEFERRFAERVSRLRVGNPAEREIQVGPLARGDLRDSLDRQVHDSVEQGAHVVLGGTPMNGRGYFYAPTILADVTPEMDRTAFWHYLTFIVAPAPLTMFRGIFKLPAGHVLTIDHRGDAAARQYWDCVPDRAATLTERDISEPEAVAELTRLLKQSIARRMVSDVPFGVLLSGGVDSSMNVALMSELMNRPVTTFTIGYEGKEDYNEFQFARRISQRYRTDHHETLISRQEMQAFLPLLVRLQDEPIADNVCIPLYFLAKLVKDSGTTVVQVGEGADENFLGYWWCEHYRRLYEAVYEPARQRQPSWKRIAAALTQPRAALSGESLEVQARARRGQELFWGGGSRSTC